METDVLEIAALRQATTVLEVHQIHLTSAQHLGQHLLYSPNQDKAI
jgi:hypothetical protein